MTASTTLSVATFQPPLERAGFGHETIALIAAAPDSNGIVRGTYASSVMFTNRCPLPPPVLAAQRSNRVPSTVLTGETVAHRPHAATAPLARETG